MPFKSRKKRLAYLRRWKKTGRPSPKPQAQSDDALPPRGIIKFSKDGEKVQCHVCGKWFRALNMHLKTHGYDAKSYKEAYGLPRTISMWPAVTKKKQSISALERDQGAIGREHIPPSKGRQPGIPSRLGTRIEASRSRKGLYMRGGARARNVKPA